MVVSVRDGMGRARSDPGSCGTFCSSPYHLVQHISIIFLDGTFWDRGPLVSRCHWFCLGRGPGPTPVTLGGFRLLPRSPSLHPLPPRSGRPCPEHPEAISLSRQHPLHARTAMAPASVAISLCVGLIPPRTCLVRRRWSRPIRASSDTTGAPTGDRRIGALERRVGDLRALVASVPPAVVSIRKNIGLNSVAGFCFGVAFLAAVARQVIIRTRQQDNSGSVAELVRRGHLKSGQRGIAKPRVYDDPFNNPLVKIDEDTSTAEMFGKEYRLAPVRLTNEQQAMHQKRRSRAYQWKRPTVYLKEGDPLPPDVDPDTVRWIPGNHPFAAGSVEVDEETAKKNVYQKDGVPSRVKAEHEALRARLEASNDVTPFSSGLRNMQPNEKSLSDQPSGNLQHSKSEMVNSQHGQPVLEPEKQSSDNSSVSKSLEGQ